MISEQLKSGFISKNLSKSREMCTYAALILQVFRYIFKVCQYPLLIQFLCFKSPWSGTQPRKRLGAIDSPSPTLLRMKTVWLSPSLADNILKVLHTMYDMYCMPYNPSGKKLFNIVLKVPLQRRVPATVVLVHNVRDHWCLKIPGSKLTRSRESCHKHADALCNGLEDGSICAVC